MVDTENPRPTRPGVKRAFPGARDGLRRWPRHPGEVPKGGECCREPARHPCHRRHRRPRPLGPVPAAGLGVPARPGAARRRAVGVGDPGGRHHGRGPPLRPRRPARLLPPGQTGRSGRRAHARAGTRAGRLCEGPGRRRPAHPGRARPRSRRPGGGPHPRVDDLPGPGPAARRLHGRLPRRSRRGAAGARHRARPLEAARLPAPGPPGDALRTPGTADRAGRLDGAACVRGHRVAAGAGRGEPRVVLGGGRPAVPQVGGAGHRPVRAHRPGRTRGPRRGGGGQGPRAGGPRLELSRLRPAARRRYSPSRIACEGQRSAASHTRGSSAVSSWPGRTKP
ncbi:putative Membrane-associated zinc metalloprotease [Streptomyces misionensis JCM 4497]